MMAELGRVMEECGSAKRIKLSEKEFNPPVEMMVTDYDDKRTLDEDALGTPEDPQAEYGGLQKSDSDKTRKTLLSYQPYSQLYPPAATSRPQSEEEDYDFSADEEECKKTIMVGSDYQAWIPEGLCRYDDALPYENDDQPLWDPCSLTSAQVETYLAQAQEQLIAAAEGVGAIPLGAHTRDDEQALYLLLRCGHNVEEALRRSRMNAVKPTDTMSLWSEEECRNFENGLRTYGKNFHLIQQNKVRTRSVGELVQFYYLWKKTERHDIFANKARLEKKKYSLHPGITDYMDRYLEEQESGGANSSGGGPGSGGSHRDRSSSPNIQCLIYGDRKRHQRSPANHLNANLSNSSGENVDCSEGSGPDEKPQ